MTAVDIAKDVIRMLDVDLISTGYLYLNVQPNKCHVCAIGSLLVSSLCGDRNRIKLAYSELLDTKDAQQYCHKELHNYFPVVTLLEIEALFENWNSEPQLGIDIWPIVHRFGLNNDRPDRLRLIMQNLIKNNGTINWDTILDERVEVAEPVKIELPEYEYA